MSTILPLRINTNVNGIPAISSQSVSVNTAGDTVTFDFLNHPTTGGVFRGWITVRLAQAVPAGTADTAEIVVTNLICGGNKRVKTTLAFKRKPINSYLENNPTWYPY